MRTYLCLGLALTAACSSSSEATAPKTDAGSPPLTFPDASKADTGHAPKPEAGTHDAGHEAAAVDAGSEAGPSDTYPASHPAIAQVANSGGPIMKSPKFVVVTFAGDALASQIVDFTQKVAASASYWADTTAEYGVGPIASVTSLTVTEAPPASLTDAQVQAWLTTQLAGPHAGDAGADSGTDAGAEAGAPWPQPDADTVYVLYYPATTTVSMGGGTSCSDFYGYHDDYPLEAGTYVTYSVVSRCPAFPGTSDIDSLTSIASHEYIEAVTDPLASDNPAYLAPDTDHTAWALPAGGELGDMCAALGNVFYTPTDVPYLVQRSWSNKAAAAGHDPCQPDGAMPYANAAAELSDMLTIHDPDEGTYTSLGTEIPVGGTGTILLDLYSDAKTSGPFTVTAYDLSSLFGGPQELDISFNGQPSATGVNGDKIPMTVKVLKAGSGGAEVLWIQSTTSANANPSVWLGVVGNSSVP